MRKYSIFFFISISIYLVHFYLVKHGVYGDGNGYFTLAHTLFFQHTLNFQPVYDHLSHFQGAAYMFSRIFWDTSQTITHVLNCPWLIGTAIFWIPSFFIICFVSLIFPLYINSFHPLYEMGCGVSGILLVLSGLFFLEKWLKTYFTPSIVFWTVILLFFTTQLFYYGTFEPALSHQPTFFLICFLLYLIHLKVKKTYHMVLIGLSLGLLFITRLIDVFVIVPFFLLYIYQLIIKHNIKTILLLIITGFVGTIPQLMLQKAMYGGWLINPYFQGEKGIFTIPTFPALFNELFSINGGFFLYSPLFIFSLLGLSKAIKKIKLKLVVLTSLISIFLFFIIIASWYKGIPAGFGNRFLVSLIPMFSIGVAFMIQNPNRRTMPFLFFCLIWNFFLLVRFYFLIK